MPHASDLITRASDRPIACHPAHTRLFQPQVTLHVEPRDDGTLTRNLTGPSLEVGSAKTTEEAVEDDVFRKLIAEGLARYNSGEGDSVLVSRAQKVREAILSCLKLQTIITHHPTKPNEGKPDQTHTDTALPTDPVRAHPARRLQHSRG